MYKAIHFRIDKKIILAAIILSGALFRLVAINKIVWFDEALSIYAARQPFLEIIPLLLGGIDMQPPIFALLLHFLLKISSSEIWLRIFPFVCSLVVLYMTYKLGKKIFNESVGLLSCLLVAYSERFISYSVEIRGYMIWVLFSLLSIYFFIKSTESPSGRLFFFYIISTTICIYVHYCGALILFSESMSLLMNKKAVKTNMRLWWLSIGCILILLIPQAIYLYFAFQKFALWGSYFQRKASVIKCIYSLFLEYSNYCGLLFFYASIIIYLILSKSRNILFGPGLLYNNIRDTLIKLLRNPKINILFAYLILPIVLVSLFSQGKYHFLESRYFLPFFIFFYLSIAYSVSLYDGKIKKLIITLIVLFTFSNAVRYSILLQNQPRIGIKKASELLKSSLEKDDIVATSDIFISLHIFNYLNIPIRILVRPQEIESFYLLKLFYSDKNNFITNFSYFKNRKRLWLITGRERGSKDNWLTESKLLKLISRIEVDRVEIRLYDIL